MLYYRKALLNPRGAYLISDLPEGGLIERGLFRERGAYSQNQVTRIYLEAFQFFYPIFCGINIQFHGSNKLIQHSFIPNHT